MNYISKPQPIYATNYYRGSTNQAFRKFIQELVNEINKLNQQIYENRQSLSATLSIHNTQVQMAGMNTIFGRPTSFPTLNVKQVTNSSSEISTQQQKLELLMGYLNKATEYNFHEYQEKLHSIGIITNQQAPRPY